ncbi:SDR family oxidoreductase [Companilactobacillus sp.]|jgi:NAD(P)-dependent dehydrogenase (short-subunit alcohol dehydrogenase family)|uniref:SDR family oxidoreductase n=1 Tax=Companilactobacillus sp. TaxID=2767905 RepID=UPI0025C2E4AC|nr:SDR family oxidoreductase [Companilactobacillus sp.]MCH4009868.1 SDR family oxidoreductase [Companilactobacillus sp.]MCH4052456.1 SDR family oxidoreductase [Companilactobacillus sp.]MCH4077810.1 SDR family oxidoreductase [Companilactobacillus sp.]MCH4126386.1 SDR family oxidoreductase [Companilactobacillus sp.]MCI1312708.1 SDR family oxidoreductase [Companilactobacillus sp.]
MTIKNKRILVVGGTSGFGREVALQAQQAGAQVQVIGHDQGRLQKFEEEHQGISATALDAHNADDLKSFFEANSNYDHLVSTLGGAMGGGFLDSSIDEIRQTIEDKFFADLQLAQIASHSLNKYGSMIFTSGSGGHPSDASGAIVGNSAINIMVKGLAVEMAPNYRVNAVSPTWTPTGLWRDMSEPDVMKQVQQFSQNVPLRRVATIPEVASGYIYLMQNNFVTGQILNIDVGIDLN